MTDEEFDWHGPVGDITPDEFAVKLLDAGVNASLALRAALNLAAEQRMFPHMFPRACPTHDSQESSKNGP